MTKIVIVRGADPNEAVFFKKAKELYELLKRRGYDVELIKVDPKFTPIGITRKAAREGIKENDVAHLLSKHWPLDVWLSEKEKKYPSSTIFIDTHTTPLDVGIFSTFVRPHQTPSKIKPIIFTDLRPTGARWITIEMPAVYKPMPRRQRDEMLKGIKRIEEAGIMGRFVDALYKYVGKVTDEKATKTAKYDIPFEKFIPYAADIILKRMEAKRSIVRTRFARVELNKRKRELERIRKEAKRKKRILAKKGKQ